MKRRDLLKGSLAGGAVLATDWLSRGVVTSAAVPANESTALLAGFAREKINPPLGTRMMGFGYRDSQRGCQGIHDDIHVRALFLDHGGEQVLILAYDLCFVGREESDCFKGALGREFDLLPRQILINTSHNHVSPAVGTWYWAGYRPAEREYVDRLERATLRAARRARANTRVVTLAAGAGDTALPLSRRKPDGKGGILFAPNPDGIVYTRLPVCRLEDQDGRPVCLLFSVSAHPSLIGGWEISAEYPGVACDLLDEHVGATATMFLQGTAGDAKPSVIGQGLDKWRPGTWEDIERAGRMIARETIAILDQGLAPIEPAIRTAITETHWPLQPVPPRGEFEAIVQAVKPEDRPRDIRCQWAARQIDMLDRGETLPTSAGVLLQIVQLGRGLRLVSMEGEPVAAWGHLIQKTLESGVTFPLGYCNGQGMYLPVSNMIPEGGYEVVSYWEYGYPSPLATGMEDIVLPALARMKETTVR